MDADRLSFANALPLPPRAALRAGARAALSRLGRHIAFGEARPALAPAVTLSVPTFGRVIYYTNARDRVEPAGTRPLLLLHGMHMRADARELTPLFAAFKAERHVYVPDLPGFGASQPGASPCHPELYVDTIKQLIELSASDALAPVDVIAVGLTCEHAARAVAALPDMVGSLVMIAPTGFAKERDESVLERFARGGRALLPVEVLERLGLARVCSAGFASVLSGVAFPKDNPQSAYTRVHCPTLVLHERSRRARYGTLARFVRWRDHYREVEVASVNLNDRAASARLVNTVALFLDASPQEETAPAKLRAG